MRDRVIGIIQLRIDGFALSDWELIDKRMCSLLTNTVSFLNDVSNLHEDVKHGLTYDLRILGVVRLYGAYQYLIQCDAPDGRLVLGLAFAISKHNFISGFLRDTQVTIGMPIEKERTRHVFISYLREDRELVDKLVTDLRNQGIRVWLDREQIAPGQRWDIAIRNAIDEGLLFLACFSRSYDQRESSYMNEELRVAIEAMRKRPPTGTWFVPVLLDDCQLPDFWISGSESIKQFQWIAIHKDWEFGIGLIRGVVDAASSKR